MSRRVIIPILFFALLSQIVLVDDLNANTAEERLIEVEKQLQAVANQIKQYEGEKTNLEKNIKTEGNKVIYFNQAFHGRSGYTLTLTNTSDPRKTMYFPKFPWFKVHNPHLTFPHNDEMIETLIKNEKKVIDSINDIVFENKGDIAAIIIEPIQGEGGDNHFRNEFMLELRRVCDENDIIFICKNIKKILIL